MEKIQIPEIPRRLLLHYPQQTFILERHHFLPTRRRSQRYILFIINIHLHALGHHGCSAIHQQTILPLQPGLRRFWHNKNLVYQLRVQVSYHRKAVKRFGVEGSRTSRLVHYFLINSFMRRNVKRKVVLVCCVRAILRRLSSSGVNIDMARK